VGHFHTTLSMRSKAFSTVKKTAYALNTALSLGIPGIKFYKQYKAQNKKSEFLKNEDAPKEVARWGQSILKQHFPEKDAKKFTFKIGSDYTPFAVDYNPPIIAISKYQCEKINRSLKKEKKDKHLYLSTAFLRHEVGHIKNKDGKKTLNAIGVIPLLTHTSSYFLSKGIRKVISYKGPRTIIGLGTYFVGNLLSGIIKTPLNFLLFSQYERNRESKADEFAFTHAKDEKELLAFRDYFGDIPFEGHLWGNVEEIYNLDEFQKILILENIKPYIIKLDLEMGDNPTKIQMIKFLGLLRIAHFICDRSHPYRDDRAHKAHKAWIKLKKQN